MSFIEVSRFKTWARSKWTRVRTVNKKLHTCKQVALNNKVQEYVARTNGNWTFSEMIRALVQCVGEGKTCKPFKF